MEGGANNVVYPIEPGMPCVQIFVVWAEASWQLQIM